MPQLKHGILIAIEGIDGSGKSTLAHNVSAALEQQGFDIVLTKEPGASALGKEVRKLIQTHVIPLTPRAEYLLFAADRAQHFAELIIPALEQKKLIISDRMADSSLAYQGYGNGLERAMIHTINSWTMTNIVPDITIFVRIPVAVALERAKNRGPLSAYEKREHFLHNVAAGFEELYKNRADIIIVDGTQSQESLNSYVCNAIEQWIHTKNYLN
ncbi:MAG TPA: dTMP kinase [Candidatus Babeliales bacterium]|jgi:dTMP kinase|nr:dTMP kinase [Candidatus Babeliales bacterium]